MDIIYFPIPVWVSIVTFAFGIVMGFILRSLYDESERKGKSILELIIQIAVISLWITATTRAVIIDSVEYPPFFLNIMFGAIAGSMNKELGKQIVSLVSSVIKRK